MSHLLRAAGVLVLTTALLLSVAGQAAADGHMVTGSSTGNLAGEQMQWNPTLPANTDATLNISFWPCINPGALQLDVYGASGLAGSAMQDGACTKSLSWNTGDGGDVLVQLTNYLHGVGVHWTITTEGFSLGEGGGTMAAMSADEGTMMAKDAAAMADDEAMADDDGVMADDDGAMAEESDDEAMMAEDEGEMMAEDAAMAPKAAMAGAETMAGTLVGDVGGAFVSYDMPVCAGETYTLRMTNGLGVGGHWPGVGFKVWGPGGLVARSMTMHGPDTATFTAAMDGTYQVQVYNYHHGQTLYYAFDMPQDEDGM